MTEPMTEQEASVLAETLRSAIAAELGGPTFPNAAAAQVVRAGTWLLDDQLVAMLQFDLGGTPLTFCVYPSRPDQPAYARCQRYDVCYQSDELSAEQQQPFYEAHRATIDAFCAWLKNWESRTPLPSEAPDVSAPKA